MNRTSFVSVFILIIAAAGCASIAKSPGGGADRTPQPGEGIPFIGKSKFDRYVLSNGLTLLVMEDHSSPTFSYQTWFRVGSRNEQVDYTGLAHFFEHLMFKRTHKHPEGDFDRTLERIGASNNASTNTDFTFFYEEAPKQYLDTIAEIESDRMVNLIVDDEAFKTEREVVQNERRMRMENSPFGQMYQETLRLSYTRQPERWPVIGFGADLERMTSKDAEKWYESYYHPNNAVVIVVGDVDSGEVFSIIKNHYGGLSPGPKPHEPTEFEPPQTAPRRSKIKLNSQVQILMVSWPIPGNSSPDGPVLDLIESLLARGKANRLDRALVDTGIATNSWCESTSALDPTLFTCGASLQEGKDAAAAEKVILDQIARLGREPVSDDEIRRAKNLMMFNIYQGLGEDESKASLLGNWEIEYGGVENGLRQIDQTMRVSAEDIRRVVSTYLLPNKRNVVMGVPK